MTDILTPLTQKLEEEGFPVALEDNKIIFPEISNDQLSWIIVLDDDHEIVLCEKTSETVNNFNLGTLHDTFQHHLDLLKRWYQERQALIQQDS